MKSGGGMKQKKIDTLELFKEGLTNFKNGYKKGYGKGYRAGRKYVDVTLKPQYATKKETEEIFGAGKGNRATK